MRLEDARPADVEDLARLVNAAYRGDRARLGWTHEAELIGGQRTDAGLLAEALARPTVRILTLRDAEGALVGCVEVEVRDGLAWIGLLSVDPSRQARGLGRRLLLAAETAARAQGAERARMSVISLRGPLIAWYARQGYAPTGETAPFPYDEPRVGAPLRADLAFVLLEKRLA